MVEIAKRRGFFWQSFQIYSGESGFYDYGPVGVLMKERFIEIFRNVYLEEGGIFIDTPAVTPAKVFQASGHLEKFEDMAVKCPSCGKFSKIESSMKISGVKNDGYSMDDVRRLISENALKCPFCGKPVSDVEMMNLMFRIPRRDDQDPYYLRPETAQGIFVNYKLLLNQNRGKLPMIVCQYGKGYRNEISPRQALIRQREFFMAEVETFLDPEMEWERPPDNAGNVRFLANSGVETVCSPAEAFSKGIVSSKQMAYFIGITHKLLRRCGIRDTHLRFRQHRKDELAHYSRDCWDAEAFMDNDWVEIVGIADRGDYDLRRHSEFSGEDFKTENGKIPVVIEPAHGVDRIILAAMNSSYTKTDKGFRVMSFSPLISPYIAAVMPLQARDGLDSIAVDFYRKLLALNSYVAYDESGSIGRRYARQDEIGTPFCFTVDYQTKDDGTVTLRERDTKAQKRYPMGDILSLPVLKNPLIMEDFRKINPDAAALLS